MPRPPAAWNIETESAQQMPPLRPASRLAAALVACAMTGAVLAGCSLGDGGKGGTGDSPSASSGTSGSQPSSSSSAGGTPSPTPTPTPTPVTLQQGQVWTPQQVYDFNPNFSPQPDYSVASSSPAAPLVKLSGVSFGWVNQTSGETIEIAVAHPSAENIDQFSGQVATGSQVVPIDNAPAGTVGYFAVAKGVGTLQVFTSNGYWVVIDSKIFLEPGDSYQIADDVMGNLQ